MLSHHNIRCEDSVNHAVLIDCLELRVVLVQICLINMNISPSMHHRPVGLHEGFYWCKSHNINCVFVYIMINDSVNTVRPAASCNLLIQTFTGTRSERFTELLGFSLRVCCLGLTWFGSDTTG